MTRVTIQIPAALREFVEGRGEVVVEADTAADALAQLTARSRALHAHLYGPDGRLRPFVHIYVGNRELRELEPDAVLADGTELRIVPSIAGG